MMDTKIDVTQTDVFLGDCLDLIQRLPGESIDVVVTSPPYWGQRSPAGGVGNGAEEDPRDYIAFLQEVFTAIAPKLKRQGIVWLNLGDAYNTPINWTGKDYKYSTLGADRTGFSPDNAAYTKPRFKRKAFVDKTTWVVAVRQFADAAATVADCAGRIRIPLSWRNHLVEKEPHAGGSLPPTAPEARAHIPFGQG